MDKILGPSFTDFHEVCQKKLSIQSESPTLFDANNTFVSVMTPGLREIAKKSLSKMLVNAFSWFYAAAEKIITERKLHPVCKS